MLRIDETSKTLVAPAGRRARARGHPDRAELLALIASGWDAFAAEIGQPGLTARRPPPRARHRHARHRRARPAAPVVVAGDRRHRVRRVGRALGRRRRGGELGRRRARAPSTSRCQATCPATRRRYAASSGRLRRRRRSRRSTGCARRHGIELSCYSVVGPALRRRAAADGAARVPAARRRRARSGRGRRASCSATPRSASPTPAACRARRRRAAARGPAPRRGSRRPTPWRRRTASCVFSS